MTATVYFVSRERLAGWLDGLAETKTLIAPREIEGVLLYRPVQSSAEIARGYTRPVLSAKEVFFPSTERLLTIERTGQQIALHEALPEGEQVIFGVRPCDARGVRVLDALFLETQPIDAHYARRRASTTLIGLACPTMGDTCFCTSVGGAPDDASDVDVMLTEVEGGYAVQPVTDHGWALIARLGREEFTGELPPPVLSEPVPLPPIEAWPPQFSSAFWQDISERCLSCRICAYVCPTCRCFDVRDEAMPGGNGQRQFERLRCWDSCTGEAYRRIAGGHNPRAVKGDRLRNRFFCKFHYYAQQYGPLACTGCGRCIDACPVNIDITEVMTAIAAAHRTEGDA